MIAVKPILSEDTVDIRQKVLRAGLSPDTCRWSEDDALTTFHLGGFLNDRLVGVSTFQKEPFPGDGDADYRLRGMAVLSELRGQGVGSLMLLAGEDRLRGRGYAAIWCQARVAAVPFYQKNGWVSLGDVFDVPGVGPHFLMIKDLTAPFGCKANTAAP